MSASAQAELDAMVDSGEAPFLTLQARLALADYDSNTLERLRCLEAMEEAGLRHPLLTAVQIEAGRHFTAPAERL